MAAKVKNVDILNALYALGVQLPAHVETVGNQHGEFMQRLADLGVNGDLFAQAEKLAGWDGNSNSIGDLVGGPLNLDEGQIRNSLTNFKSLQTTGQLPASPTQIAGPAVPMQLPPSAQGRIVPPPPAQMPVAPPVAPLSQAPQDDKIGPHPGAAAVAQTQANVAAKAAPVATPAAAGGVIAGGGAGGGVSNQPPSPATWNDDQIKTFIKQNFGANAYFVDIPEVWNALKDVVKSGKGANGLEPALEGTAFWKQNNAAARNWYVRQKADPAQTAADVAQQTQAIQGVAQQAGLTLDPERAQEMAQSYLRYGWTQTDLQRAIGAEWHYDPTTKNQAAAVTKMKADAQNWLVPLSDQAIQTWGQGLISGTVSQDQYSQYLRDNAKSLMPQLTTLIDQHASDPNFSVSTFADPYKQQAANMLGIQANQIDLNDSKWRKALDTVDPKTGERRIMSLGEWESTIKTDPTYGYDKTANGINDGLQLASALKTSMGF